MYTAVRKRGLTLDFERDLKSAIASKIKGKNKKTKDSNLDNSNRKRCWTFDNGLDSTVRNNVFFVGVFEL